MRQNTVKMTTAQFAELHGVNRRTLHYYDDIGLFSPCQKGEKPVTAITTHHRALFLSISVC